MIAPHRVSLLLLAALTIAACTSGPSESDIQTAIAATQAANPTGTASPEPTLTRTASSTPTRTASPTRTATATRTDTATPLPPGTQTALARFATQTAVSLHSTATRQAANARGTATVQAYWAHATLIAQYTRIPARELITYPDSHTGERVVVQGWVFNVNGNEELQMYVRGTYDAIYVVMASPFSDIYEDMSITVYGTVAGETCFTNAYGAEVCQPLLVDAFYVP
jgi:hypothetical protein